MLGCNVGMPSFSGIVCLMKDQKRLGFVLRLSPSDIIDVVVIGFGYFFLDYFP